MRNLVVSLCGIVLLSFCANMIANDRPLLLVRHHKIFVPLLKDYVYTDFGLPENKPVVFYDSIPGQALLHQSIFVVHPLIRFGPNTVDLALIAPHPPTSVHWLGTDDHGRDVLVRLLYGLRLSVLFGLTLAVLGMVIGIVIGSVQGYMGGMVDLLMGRIIDLWTSIPSMFLVLIIISFMRPNFWLLLGICLMFHWVQVAAVTRSECLRIRQQDYVRAAEILGASPFRIMFKHILPNAMFGIFVYFPYLFTNGIIQLTALTFLGFGIPSQTPSLGDLLNQAKENLHAPWIGLSVLVTLVILLTLLMNMSEKMREKYLLK